MGDEPSLREPVEEEPCFVCRVPFKPGDRFYFDLSGGCLHAECCGPERESYHIDGEPLGPEDPIPEPEIWEDL